MWLWRKDWLALPLAASLVVTGMLGALGAPSGSASAAPELAVAPALETASGLESAPASATASLAAPSFEAGVSANITTKDDIPDFANVHPRVLTTPVHVAALRQKLASDPEYYDDWTTIVRSDSALSKAFRYLIEEDEALGRAAIEETLTALQTMPESHRENNGRSAMTIYFWAPLVYDWCYDLLTAQEKDAFIEAFIDFAQTPGKPPGYPIDPNAIVVSSHHTAGWYWHQLTIGLAIYDELPDMWNGAIDFFFDRHRIAENWMLASGLHHQGTGYFGSRYVHLALFQAMVDRLTGGGRVYDESQRRLPYQLIYHLRPDGEMLRSGDMSTQHGLEEFKVTLLQLMANLHQDEYLYHASEYYARRDAAMETILDLLMREAELGGKEGFDGLPLAMYFPEPVGAEMVARSGWDIGGPASDDFLVQMRIGKYMFGNHQHYDMGTFQIFYKGALTGDSGTYRGATADYGTDHWRHYYRSTIAHNGLIIYNPDQIDGSTYANPQNDGGIRYPSSGDWQPAHIEDVTNPRNGYDVADVLAYGTDEAEDGFRYAYISGDLTKGYLHTYDDANPDRADQVTRSMATMPTEEAEHPFTFFVFDRIEGSDASYAKKFIMHTAEAPAIDGNRATASAARPNDGYAGELTSWTLLPKTPVLEVVEGYSVGYGDNEATYPHGDVPDSSYEEMTHRLEVSSASGGTSERFLHAMTVSADGRPVAAAAELVEAGNAVGAKLLNNTVLFSDDGTLLSDVLVTIEGEGTQRVLVTDLNPGAYLVDRIDRKPGDFLLHREVDSTCGCLYFEGGAGTYYVTRAMIDEGIANRLAAGRGGDLAAPVVEASVPSAVLTGTAELTASASDNVGVAGVRFLLDGARIGEELTAAPYVWAWDTTAVPDGAYALQAVARDAAGRESASAPIAVTIHNEPGFLPVRETFAGGASAFAAVSGSWSAANGKYRLDSPGGLAVHERSFEDDLAVRVEAALLSLPDGEQDLRVIFDYTDSSRYYYAGIGVSEADSGIFKVVDGTVERLAPLAASVVPGATVELQVNRIGDAIDVYVDGDFVGQGRDAALNGGKVGVGSAAGPARFDRFSVTPIVGGAEVDVEPPTVSVAAPANGATVAGETALAAAADDNRGVASVQFLLDGLALGPAIPGGETYAYRWDTSLFPNGTYALAARATDGAGNSTLSPPVAVTIDNPLGDAVLAENFSEGADRFVIVRGHWTAGDGQFRIVNPPSDPTNGSIAVHETAVRGDYIVTVRAQNTDSWNGFRDFSVIFEYQDEANFYYVNFGQRSDNNSGGIFRIADGVKTKLASLTGFVNPDRMYAVAVKRTGDAIEAYISGEPVGSVVDATFMSGGAVGLGSINDLTTFERFAVIGGELDEEPGPSVTASLSSDLATVPANGNAKATITVRLKDANGADLTENVGAVTLHTTHGTLSELTDHGGGMHSAKLSASAAGEAVVTARLDGKRIGNELRIVFRSVPANPGGNNGGSGNGGNNGNNGNNGNGGNRGNGAVRETYDDLGRVQLVLDAAALEERLRELAPNEPFVIEAAAEAGGYTVSMGREAIERLIAREGLAEVEVRTSFGTYAIPLQWLGLAALEDEDEVVLTIEAVEANAMPSDGGTVIAPYVEFKLGILSGGTLRELDSFGSTYVTRTLYLDVQDVDPSRATGVVVDLETGEMRFVPTVFRREAGRWAAVMQRNGNSVYTVVTADKTFDDIASHWAAETIESLASKRIVHGAAERLFEPEAAVTRAQFTTLLVRALGLDDAVVDVEGGGFADVQADDWFAGAVHAAQRAGLANGVGGRRFEPERAISRQELAAMLSQALDFLGRGAEAAEPSALAAYEDASSIGDGYANAVAKATRLGLMQGQGDRFAPLASATRAEAAVVLQRLLRKVGFID